MKKLLVLLASLLVALGAAEALVRVTPSTFGVRPRLLQNLRAYLDEDVVLFEGHPYVGYVRAGTPKDFTQPTHWSFPPAEPGVPRIACLGGSTTAGNLPRHLAEELYRRTGRVCQVMNWGVSGWSSAESLVNYFLNVQDYAPDVVVVHHATNDVLPRTRAGFRSDYSHWRMPWTKPRIGAVTRWLMQRSDLCAAVGLRTLPGQRLRDLVERPGEGIDMQAPAELLPPDTQHTFERNVAGIAEHVSSHGGHVVLLTMPYRLADGRAADGELTVWGAGMDEHNGILRELCASHGWALADAAAAFAAEPGTSQKLFLDRVHVARDGDKWKARLVADAILEGGFLPPPVDERPPQEAPAQAVEAPAGERTEGG